MPVGQSRVSADFNNAPVGSFFSSIEKLPGYYLYVLLNESRRHVKERCTVLYLHVAVKKFIKLYLGIGDEGARHVIRLHRILAQSKTEPVSRVLSVLP